MGCASRHLRCARKPLNKDMAAAEGTYQGVPGIHKAMSPWRPVAD